MSLDVETSIRDVQERFRILDMYNLLVSGFRAPKLDFPFGIVSFSILVQQVAHSTFGNLMITITFYLFSALRGSYRGLK